MTQGAAEFAERFESERKRWREYERNRRENTYDGDWGELVSEINEIVA